MNIKGSQCVVLYIFVGLVISILLDNIFSLSATKASINNYYGTILVPLIGGVSGLYYFIKRIDQWGKYRLKVIFFLSTTLILWAVGTIIFTYYTLASDTEVPYPSAADLAYFFCGTLSVVGVYYVACWLGIKEKLKEFPSKIILVAVSIIVFGITYDLYSQVFRQDIAQSVSLMKIGLDIFYPLTDAFNLLFISLGLLLTREKLFKRWNPILYIYVGSFFSYSANFFFSYSTTNNTYVVGNWIDLMFSIAMSLMAVGVILFAYNTDEEKV